DRLTRALRGGAAGERQAAVGEEPLRPLLGVAGRNDEEDAALGPAPAGVEGDRADRENDAAIGLGAGLAGAELGADLLDLGLEALDQGRRPVDADRQVVELLSALQLDGLVVADSDVVAGPRHLAEEAVLRRDAPERLDLGAGHLRPVDVVRLV